MPINLRARSVKAISMMVKLRPISILAVCLLMVASIGETLSQTPSLLLDSSGDSQSEAPFHAIWNTIPSLRYELQKSSDLENWTTIEGYPIEAPTVSVSHPIDSPSLFEFYRVKLIDEQGPTIVEQDPSPGSYVVGRLDPIAITLSDSSHVDPSSIVLNVGDVESLTVADPRLEFTGGVLTYTPLSPPWAILAKPSRWC